MSSIKLILAFWRERYQTSIFLPLAIVIAAAGSAAVGSVPSIREGVTGVVLAYTLVLLFRIVDDLADLAGDRLKHPTRVLVQASNVMPVVGLAFIVATADILIILTQARPIPRLVVAGVLSVSLLLWYFLRAQLRVGPLASAHAILVKYPVISLLTCASWSQLSVPAALTSFGTLYLGVCIYEQAHDRTVRKSRGSGWLFAAEIGLLVCIPLLVFSTGGFLR